MPQPREGAPVDLSKLVKQDGSIDLEFFADKVAPQGSMDFMGFSGTVRDALNLNRRGKCPLDKMVIEAFQKGGLEGVRNMFATTGLSESIPITDEQVAVVDTKRREVIAQIQAGGKKRGFFGR